VWQGEEAAQRGLVYACIDDADLLPTAAAMAASAAALPPELAQRAKQTLRDIAALDDHSEAVDLEIAAQLWSLQQPFFAERLAALKARISSR
jgi:enoyl-CoA hydratase